MTFLIREKLICGPNDENISNCKGKNENGYVVSPEKFLYVSDISNYVDQNNGLIFYEIMFVGLIP